MPDPPQFPNDELWTFVQLCILHYRVTHNWNLSSLLMSSCASGGYSDLPQHHTFPTFLLTASTLMRSVPEGLQTPPVGQPFFSFYPVTVPPASA